MQSIFTNQTFLQRFGTASMASERVEILCNLFYKSNFSSKIWDCEYGERSSGGTYYLYLQIFKDLGSGDTCNLYLPIQLFFKELGRWGRRETKWRYHTIKFLRSQLFFKDLVRYVFSAPAYVYISSL